MIYFKKRKDNMSKIAIETGHSFIRMYIQDRDLFVKEPSLKVNRKSANGGSALGLAAKRLSVKAPGTVSRPDPLMTDASAAEALLGIADKYIYFSPKEKISFYISAENSMTEGEKLRIKDVFSKRYPSSECLFIPSVYAAAIGSGMLLEDGRYRMTVEMTATGTNLTVLRGYSCFINKFIKIGSKDIESAAESKLLTDKNIKIPSKDIKKIVKRLVFSDLGARERLRLRGTDTVTGLPRTEEIAPGYFDDAVRPVADRLWEALLQTVNVMPEQAKCSLLDGNISFVSGDTVPEGLCSFLSEKAGIDIIDVQDGENCVIYGLEKMISENIPVPEVEIVPLFAKNTEDSSLSRELTRKHFKMAYDFDVELVDKEAEETEAAAKETASAKEEKDAQE
ncbi:MAG: hypothetical protein E7623_04755 [Ruminococcaceae bacterium]|nr:hypothetical protein [Oscillospiraceae bacterium]